MYVFYVIVDRERKCGVVKSLFIPIYLPQWWIGKASDDHGIDGGWCNLCPRFIGQSINCLTNWPRISGDIGVVPRTNDNNHKCKSVFPFLCCIRATDRLYFMGIMLGPENDINYILSHKKKTVSIRLSKRVKSRDTTSFRNNLRLAWLRESI